MKRLIELTEQELKAIIQSLKFCRELHKKHDSIVGAEILTQLIIKLETERNSK